MNEAARGSQGLRAGYGRLRRWASRTLLEPEYPLVAIEVRPRAVAAVRLARERGGVVLGAATVVEIPEGVLDVSLTRPNLVDSAGFGAVLQTALERAGALSGGAVSLVLPKCVRADDVRRSIDLSVLILIGGMLSLGMAFQKHGLGDRVAEWMQIIGGGIEHPHAVIALLFVTTLGLTQVINHLAAGVLMAPVAISLSESLGISDRPLLMVVFTGAEFAFMSPVAHQANAMIMGPGDYRYRDFLRCGTPLTIVLVVVATLLIPVFWPIGG